MQQSPKLPYGGAIPSVRAILFGVVAQLVRASACHAEGRGIEARPSRQFCRHRLTVRTAGFHLANRGSIPRGGTNFVYVINRS